MPHDRLRPLAAALALASAVAAHAGEVPLAHRDAASAFLRVDVPAAVMARTKNADLSDIRVLNARGEVLPHAWLDEPAPAEVRESQHTLPFFRMPAPAASSAEGGRGGWVIDARAVTSPLTQLQLAAPAGHRGIHGFSVEQSDDLQHWQTHTPSAQWVSLERDGQQLVSTGVELGGVRARYLRLRPLPGQPMLPLSAVQATSVSHHDAVPRLEWSAPLPPASCTADQCDYTLPRHLPLERLSWQWAGRNAVVPVTLLVQYAPGDAGPPAAQRKRDRVRDRLSGLHGKTAPASASPDPWTPLGQLTLYRVDGPEGEARSPDTVLHAGLVTRLRVVPKGGVAQFGATPPALRVGARAASLAFLAQPPAPYRLQWGGAEPGNALTLAQLMPFHRANDPLPTGTATVVLDALPPEVVPAASPAPVATAGATETPPRRFWLWGVLVAAVGLMGFMAWSLLRPARPTGSPPAG